ncbi:MAG: phosphoglucosamine mutase [Puniceicoccaceae bacterium]|nr:MAG: phosphoglucosamine mutase [Puniceicoccaceae bacterium]
MAQYFGTDGVRGLYGTPNMCPEFAYRLGRALGRYLMRNEPRRPISVILGRDTRGSGPLLSDALASGLNELSVYVYNGGVVPTPAVARSVVEQRADLGLVVTASHNPESDNGIKLFDARGCKLSEAEELEIEALLDKEPGAPETLPAPKYYALDVAAFYVNYLRSMMDQHCLKRWTIVLDLANGATHETSPAVFERWGADLHLIGRDPDKGLINDGVGSEHTEQLARAVLEKKANVGIAFDGDGDRVVVCDEKGRIVDGDTLLGLFGIYAMRAGELGAGTLVATVHSNLGLDRALASVGGKVERVDVGDRNVARRMREMGANIGGESSGHIIFSDFATTGDGLLAATKLIELMFRTGKPLSELADEITLFPQLSKNLKVAEKRPFESLKYLPEKKLLVENQLGDSGRVLIRYSGTEPKLRLLVEGADPAILESALTDLETAARRDLCIIDS